MDFFSDLSYFGRLFIAYLILLGRVWYLCLPVGVTLAYITYSTQGGWIQRSLTCIGALFFIIPVIFAGVMTYENYTDKRDAKQSIEAHSWTLKELTNVAGIDLPATTKVYVKSTFDMKKQARTTLGDIERIEFSKPTSIFGITLTDTLYHSDYKWQGNLQGNQMVEGWPCSGAITLNEDLDYNTTTDKLKRSINLQLCTLYTSHKVFSHMMPAGTQIELNSTNWTFHFPKDGRILSFDPDSGRVIFDSDSPDKY